MMQCLKIIKGETIADPVAIDEKCRQYYESLFSAEID